MLLVMIFRPTSAFKISYPSQAEKKSNPLLAPNHSRSLHETWGKPSFLAAARLLDATNINPLTRRTSFPPRFKRMQHGRIIRFTPKPAFQSGRSKYCYVHALERGYKPCLVKFRLGWGASSLLEDRDPGAGTNQRAAWDQRPHGTQDEVACLILEL